MAVLKEIVQNILIYYLILSVLMALISNSSYKKYIEMFSGLVMIIIILNPLIKLFGAEGTLDMELQKNQLYEITQAESESIMVAELKQSDAVLEQYQNTIRQQVNAVMENYDYYATDVAITIDDSLESDSFGQVKEIEVFCLKGTDENIAEASTIEEVEIPEIKIKTKEELEQQTEDTLETKEVTLEIANMYGLGVEQIRIQVEEDAGNER